MRSVYEYLNGESQENHDILKVYLINHESEESHNILKPHPIFCLNFPGRRLIFSSIKCWLVAFMPWRVLLVV